MRGHGAGAARDRDAAALPPDGVAEPLHAAVRHGPGAGVDVCTDAAPGAGRATGVVASGGGGLGKRMRGQAVSWRRPDALPFGRKRQGLGRTV